MKMVRCPYFELNDLERAYRDHARFCFRYNELRKGEDDLLP